ncbi:hypothetical protein [Moorena sp. SIO4A1]|nr:hypothetical protein [Moorena sp. SIO4A1]
MIKLHNCFLGWGERLATDQESQNAIAKWLEANVGTSFDDPY